MDEERGYARAGGKQGMTDQKNQEMNTPSPSDNGQVKSLTIPPGRLKGSPRCLNCETDLIGPFCYYCGQPDKNFMRFFPVLMRELMEDFFDLDSRLMRTLKPLLFPAGQTDPGLPARAAFPLYTAAAFVHFFQHALLHSGGDAGRRCNHDQFRR